MKSITIFLTLLCCTSQLFSQDLDKIQQNDTIYILFNQSELQKKLSVKNYDNNGYFFNQIVFFKSEIIVNNSYDNVKIRDATVLKKSKKFLCKIKNKTIDIDFIKNLGNRQVVEFFEQKKRIYYIIDEAEYTKKHIRLREVNAPVLLVE